MYVTQSKETLMTTIAFDGKILAADKAMTGDQGSSPIA